MLLPADVIPYLTSDDPILRGHAARYFENAADAGPLTADHVWAAIDHQGLGRSTVDLVRLLDVVPPTDASTGRLIDAIAATTDSGALRNALIHRVEWLDTAQLVRHRERILALPNLAERTRDHIEDRLALADAPLDDLWGRLFDSPADAVAPESEEERAALYSSKDRLAEAIAARGADAVGARALAILEDPADRDSDREDYAVEILGRVRYRPALEAMVRRFAEADDTTGDFLLEAMQEGVPRVGGADAVPLIEAAFADASWSFRIYAADALGRIMHPASEAAILRLLDDEADVEDAWDQLADAALKLCSREAASRIWQRIAVDHDFDAQLFDLEQDLVAVALMTNLDFPELGELRAEVVAKDVERRRQIESGAFDRMADEFAQAFRGAGTADDDDFDDDYDDWADDEPGYPALPDRLDDHYARPTLPIRNDQPKVGRNDPCPCGSGKKYKKCCLGKS
jgi:hypothetical protein